MPEIHVNTNNSEQVLDNLSTAVMVFDDQFRLRYVNQAGEVMLAHSARHACGRSVHELVTNAGTTAQDICRFLNLEFHPDMLQPYREKKQRMTDGVYSQGIMLGDM
jgi:nitrogen-specific signal transduction histidine kinase